MQSKGSNEKQFFQNCLQILVIAETESLMMFWLISHI